MSYGHLTLEERYQIAAMCDVKCSLTEISNLSCSTVSRELNRDDRENLPRNIGSACRFDQAQPGSSHLNIYAAMIQRIDANLH